MPAPSQILPVYPSQWLSHLTIIPDGWIALPHETELKLCQISSQTVLSVSPLAVTRSFVVRADYSWILHVNNHLVDPKLISSIQKIPSLLDATLTTTLLQPVCMLNTCVGNPDMKFTELAKSKKNGQFFSRKQKVVAYLDSGFCVLMDGQQDVSTVRCSNCHLHVKRSIQVY